MIHGFLPVVGPALAGPPGPSLPSGLGLALATFVAVAVAAVLWRRRRTRARIARLAAAAEALARGEEGVRPEVPGGGPLGALAAALDRAAARAERLGAELGARERELRQLVNHDALTGLPNRRLLGELLAKEIAHARRSGEFLAVLLLDLDHFGAINGRFGEEFGDRLLKDVAARICAVVREADTVARSGDDEFALVLPNARRADYFLSAADRLFAALDHPFQIDGEEVFVSASGGASICPQDGTEPAALLAHAREALAAAKDQGRKNLQLYDRSRRDWARRQLGLDQDLRRALKLGQLAVHYQPQVALEDGTIIGLEGLVRWHHPERGLLAAATFIPIAERIGLMPQLGAWLLGEICRQNAAWCRDGLPHRPVSVNVSARQFQAGDLPQVVASALATHGLGAELLQLEITESIAMHGIEQVDAALAELQSLGVKVHLDDFGTGYSSLGCLLRHPVDVLKIDRSFVAEVPQGEHGAAIVRATIALAESLGLAVVAEGVETVEQLDFLRRQGCQAAQGYLLGEPLPARKLAALLRRGVVPLPTRRGAAARSAAAASGSV